MFFVLIKVAIEFS